MRHLAMFLILLSLGLFASGCGQTADAPGDDPSPAVAEPGVGEPGVGEPDVGEPDAGEPNADADADAAPEAAKPAAEDAPK